VGEGLGERVKGEKESKQYPRPLTGERQYFSIKHFHPKIDRSFVLFEY